jgi:hypothetical protein
MILFLQIQYTPAFGFCLYRWFTQYGQKFIYERARRPAVFHWSALLFSKRFAASKGLPPNEKYARFLSARIY